MNRGITVYNIYGNTERDDECGENGSSLNYQEHVTGIDGLYFE